MRLSSIGRVVRLSSNGRVVGLSSIGRVVRLSSIGLIVRLSSNGRVVGLSSIGRVRVRVEFGWMSSEIDFVQVVHVRAGGYYIAKSKQKTDTYTYLSKKKVNKPKI